MGFPKILLFVWPCSFDSKLPGTLAAQHILGRTETAVGHGGSFHHKDSVLTQVMPKICQHQFLIRLYKNPQQALQKHPKSALRIAPRKVFYCHICSLMVGLQPAQEDKEPSRLFWLCGLTLRYPELSTDPVGCSGEHPTDGCAAPATPWWAQEGILQTDTLLFPRRLPCIAPPAGELRGRQDLIRRIWRKADFVM